MTAAELAGRLDAKPVAGGWIARCPAHDDKSPSLSIGTGDDGRVLLKCHAGCACEAICKEAGVELKDLFPEKWRPTVHHGGNGKNGGNGAHAVAQKEPPPPPLSADDVAREARALREDPIAWRHVTEVLRFSPAVVAELQLGLIEAGGGRRWLAYPYQRKSGAWSYANCRSLDEEKDFLRWPRGQTTRLYREGALEPGGVAILFEGERDVAAALTLGLAAEVADDVVIVGMPGAEQTRVAVEALRDQRLVYLATDADEAGDAAAEKIAAELGAARCRRVRLHGHKDLGDALAAVGPGAALEAAVAAVREAQESAADPSGVRKMLRGSICRFSAAELESPPPRQEFVFWPYIPARTVTTLAGPGGSAKTTLLTYLAVCRALALPFFGGPIPRRGKTAIFTTEDNRDDYWRKLAAVRHELGDQFDAQRVAESVFLFDLPGVPVRLVESDHGTFRPTALADHLAAVLTSDMPGADLVVVETVSRLAGGVETNESLSILVESAQRVCRLAGVAVLLVSHVSQEAGRAGTADQYAPRGGSALGDNGRSTMVLTPINANNRKQFAPDSELSIEDFEHTLVLTHPKSNGTQRAKPLLLERISTPYGPALRPASPRLRQVVDPSILRARVLGVIAGLAAKGVPVSRRSILRTYMDDLKCSRAMAERVIDQLVADGSIAETKSRTGGRGAMLVPLRDPEESGAQEPSAHRCAPLRTDDQPTLFSPENGPED